MNLPQLSLQHPYLVIAACLLVAALGGFAFVRTPTDLFPDTVPPQVTVITVWPGADADDVADKITEVMEKELNTLGLLERIRSTSRDEVSSINVQFDYAKNPGEALLDVQNAIERIRAELPKDILEPRLYRISDATRPLLTIALSPARNSAKTLAEIRLLAENRIEDDLLALPGVADVDVFGGHRFEIHVRTSRERLAALDLSIQDVLAALARYNVSAPAGTVYAPGREFLVKVSGEFGNLEDVRNAPIRFESGGRVIHIRDVAEVCLAQEDPRSIYHGNGRKAIAINVLKNDGGDTVRAISSVKAFLPELKQKYPDILFEVTDDQQPLIDLNVSGMRSSLVQAVILTVLVIFLFLADIRAATVVSVSIPMAFLSSLVVLWFSPYTMNMVTLSGLIIAVGMVVDASIVVLENIYRHSREEPELEPCEAAAKGAGEVALAITAGMLTTVVVLVPVMFAGGYTQQIMRPLNLMISSTLAASLIAALTIVPLMASRLIVRGTEHERNLLERAVSVVDRLVSALVGIYSTIVESALAARWLVLVAALAFLAVTGRKVKPLLGGELMPPMDTGIVNIDFSAPSDTSPARMEAILGRIEKVVYETPGILTVSSVTGSEPGQISFGGGGATAQGGRVKVVLVDRTKRKKDIWTIQDEWRRRMAVIDGIENFSIAEFGATPVSTTKAPMDIVITGPDLDVLDTLASRVLLTLDGTPGLLDARRSWYVDKRSCRITIDKELAELYRIPPARAALELRTAVNGVRATSMRLTGFLDIPIKVRSMAHEVTYPCQLGDVYMRNAAGATPIPFRSFANIEPHLARPFITREDLRESIDITGVNRGLTIAQLTDEVRKRLSAIEVPEGYRIDISGSAVDMAKGQREMGRALMIGIVMLLILLIAMFGSFLHPFTIMSAIPLAVAGGLWGLLLFDKPMCKPAMMGFILLGGTIVNNSILLLDFIISARKSGMNREEAIVQSVRLRLRPILMTTVSTIVGLAPLILELAVGLERMSPLGIVAAFGLAIGTFLTLVVVPVVYSLLDDLSSLFAAR